MLDRFQQFSFSVSEIHRYLLQIERDEMEKLGYNAYFAPYLVIMSRHPDGVTAVELGRSCDKDKAAVSRALNELEKQGLTVPNDICAAGYDGIHFSQLLRCNGFKMGEVETAVVLAYIGTRLGDMIAENGFQGSLQQMDGGVVRFDPFSACLIDLRSQSVAFSDSPLMQNDMVQILPVRRFLDILDFRFDIVIR